MEGTPIDMRSLFKLRGNSAKLRYRQYIDILRFFYPSLKKWTEGEESEDLRKRIIDVFNVIDKYGSRVGTIEEKMTYFRRTTSQVIGENRFNSIEHAINIHHNLLASEKFADVIVIKYVFVH